VLNGTSSPVPLKNITVRYYYTNDTATGTPTFFDNWANIRTPGVANINVTFGDTIGAVSPAVTGADTYIEFSFSGTPGLSVPSGSYLEFDWEIHTYDASGWTQSNDYSFNASDCSALAAWDHIVVLDSGNVVFGVVP
jgi:hypothetical protein